MIDINALDRVVLYFNDGKRTTVDITGYRLLPDGQVSWLEGYEVNVASAHPNTTMIFVWSSIKQIKPLAKKT